MANGASKMNQVKSVSDHQYFTICSVAKDWPRKMKVRVKHHQQTILQQHILNLLCKEWNQYRTMLLSLQSPSYNENDITNTAGKNGIAMISCYKQGFTPCI